MEMKFFTKNEDGVIALRPADSDLLKNDRQKDGFLTSHALAGAQSGGGANVYEPYLLAIQRRNKGAEIKLLDVRSFHNKKLVVYQRQRQEDGVEVSYLMAGVLTTFSNQSSQVFMLQKEAKMATTAAEAAQRLRGGKSVIATVLTTSVEPDACAALVPFLA